MPNVLVILAEGFEETEAVAVIDVLRRADIQVTTAALTKQVVMGAHGIAVLSECLLDEVEGKSFDAIVLPGGMPGSRHLRDDARVQRRLREQHQRGGVVAAICAAPMALEAAGVLKGRRATAYPGTELPSAEFSEARVVVDGHIVTSRGPGTAIEFALALVEILGEGSRRRPSP